MERIELIDNFTHPKTGKTSHCYRITYRSLDRTLTNEEINQLQLKVRDRSIAELGVDVEIGPFAVVEDEVVVGDRTRISARASVKSGTQLGSENTICEGAVVGGLPQHLVQPESPGLLMSSVTVKSVLMSRRVSEPSK